ALSEQGLDVEGAPSPEEAVREVAKGRADCAVVLKSVGLYFIKRNHLDALAASGPPLFPQKYCFAIHKNDAELLSRLNEGLFIVKENGKYAELYNRHFGALETGELPFTAILRRALVVVVPILAVLAGVLGWTWALRRLVRQRTLSLRQELLERRRVEESLRQSEERYRMLTEQNHDLVCELDADGRFSYVNPNYVSITGRTTADMIGWPALDPELFDSDDLARVAGMWPSIATVGTRISLDYRLRNPATGEWHWFDTRTSAFLNSAGETRVVFVSRDVTERRRTDDLLRQAQKLESLGLLAGGIAHDFNNLLTAILGNLNLAQNSLSELSPAVRYLGNVEKTVIKASDLTKQLLAYSGKGRFVVASVNINQVVQEMTHLLQVSIPKKIALRYRLAPDPPAVEADVAQLQQVVMNLVTNASDAIGDQDGTITISTTTQELDEAYITSTFPTQAITPGAYVVLEVGDTGCGMPPEVLARIFDPFFTTKVSGRGLGLSAMLGILRGHRAGLKIYTEPGRGSIFKLFFKAHAQASRPQREHAPHPAEIFTGTVLLVDDEPSILESTSTALGVMGFNVLTAKDGQEAVDLLAAQAGTVDLVIMDLTMPRMDGGAAFRAMRRLHPSLPVILCSGYSEQESIQDLLGKNLTAFLQKPYPLEALRKTVRFALSKAGADDQINAVPEASPRP
ncbi:MAG TPA: response regulator, partial [Holophaga sp.]|nr:response regulator [Holophaga sp.]